jgi:endogenous inhibitor of DNA gyrase (YacG/DUF329 family)
LGRKVKYSHEYVYEFFQEHECELLEEEFLNTSTPMRYRCSCGNTSLICFSSFKRGSRCSDCKKRKLANSSRKYTIDDVREIFSNKGCTLLETSYENSKQLLKYICKCGNSHKIRLTNFKDQGNSCPECKKQALHDAFYRSVEVRCSICTKSLTRNPYRLKEGSLVFCSNKCKGVWLKEASLGENNPNWNETLTAEERAKGRNFPEYYEWRILIYKKDGHTCVKCASRKNLVAHHLDAYHWAKEKRTNVDNGVTLCKDCHGDFHREYGRYYNTREQFDDWIKSKKTKDAI